MVESETNQEVAGPDYYTRIKRLEAMSSNSKRPQPIKVNPKSSEHFEKLKEERAFAP